MTKEEAIDIIKCLAWHTRPDEESIEQAIKALEQDNKEIFKQFKKKVFLESEDVLGYEMVDSYKITDYLAELMGVEND